MNSDKISFYFLNVGQGDGHLIVFSDASAILIDGGPDASLLANYLKDIKCTLKMIFLTHTHDDHYNAFFEMLNRDDAKDIFGELEYFGFVYDGHEDSDTIVAIEEMIKDALEESLIPNPDVLDKYEKPYTMPESSHPNLEFPGGFNLHILHPTLEESTHAQSEQFLNKPYDWKNQTSIVIRVDYNSSSVLFGADVDMVRWEKLMDLNRQEKLSLKSNIFVVSHHGAPQSVLHNKTKQIKPEWETLIANFIKPDYAFISVGNKYPKHPLYQIFPVFKQIGCHVACSNLTKQCHEDWPYSGEKKLVGDFYQVKELTACMGTMIAEVNSAEINVVRKDAHEARKNNWGVPLCRRDA